MLYVLSFFTRADVCMSDVLADCRYSIVGTIQRADEGHHGDLVVAADVFV